MLCQIHNSLLKCLDANATINSQDLGFGSGFSDMAPKVVGRGERKKYIGYHNLKFCSSKDISKKLKRQSLYQETTFTNYRKGGKLWAKTTGKSTYKLQKGTESEL